MNQRASKKLVRVYFPNGTTRYVSPDWLQLHSQDLVFKTVPFPGPPSKPKAFANPNSFGYGGGETPWPFDRHRAYQDARYRAGIRNAINASWTASNWQFAAKRLLIAILEDLLALYEM